MKRASKVVYLMCLVVYTHYMAIKPPYQDDLTDNEVIFNLSEVFAKVQDFATSLVLKVHILLQWQTAVKKQWTTCRIKTETWFWGLLKIDSQKKIQSTFCRWTPSFSIINRIIHMRFRSNNGDEADRNLQSFLLQYSKTGL